MSWVSLTRSCQKFRHPSLSEINVVDVCPLKWPRWCKGSVLLLHVYYLWPSFSFGHLHRWNNGLSSVSMQKVSPNPRYPGREAWGEPAPRLSLQGVLQVCRGVPCPGDHLSPRLSEDKAELQQEPQEDKKLAQGVTRKSQTQLPEALAQHIKLQGSLCLSSNCNSCYTTTWHCRLIQKPSLFHEHWLWTTVAINKHFIKMSGFSPGGSIKKSDTKIIGSKTIPWNLCEMKEGKIEQGRKHKL